MLTWSTRLRRRPRPPATTQEHVIQAEGILLDVPRRRALIDGYLVHLPAREAAVLAVLMAHAGQIVHRAALADAAGGNDQPDHPDLDRLMQRLRRRTEPSPLSPARLHHVSDTGYLFQLDSPGGSR
jgi:DNA-binding response OmpR family regulator